MASCRAAPTTRCCTRRVGHRQPAKHRTSTPTERCRRTASGGQVSRLGNPLINEVVIPTAKKDYWNSQKPEHRLAVREVLQGAGDHRGRQRAVRRARHPATTNRNDLVAVLLTGIDIPDSATVPGGLQFTRTGHTQADMLRVNTGIKPNAAGACVFGWPVVAPRAGSGPSMATCAASPTAGASRRRDRHRAPRPGRGLRADPQRGPRRAEPHPQQPARRWRRHQRPAVPRPRSRTSGRHREATNTSTSTAATDRASSRSQDDGPGIPPGPLDSWCQPETQSTFGPSTGRTIGYRAWKAVEGVIRKGTTCLAIRSHHRCTALVGRDPRWTGPPRDRCGVRHVRHGRHRDRGHVLDRRATPRSTSHGPRRRLTASLPATRQPALCRLACARQLTRVAAPPEAGRSIPAPLLDTVSPTRMMPGP